MELKCVLKRCSNLNGNAGDRIYPKVTNYNLISADSFISEVASRRQLTEGEIKSVLSGVVEVLAYLIGGGHSVTIDRLGTFSVSMKGGVAADARGVLQLKDARVKGVNFIPAKALKAALGDVKFSLVNHNVTEAAQLDDAKALEAARRAVGERGFFIRSEFAKAAGVSYSYAGKVLARLVESGALSCESLGHSHIFRVA